MRNRPVGSAYRNGMTDGWTFHNTPMVYDCVGEKPRVRKVMTPSEARYMVFAIRGELHQRLKWKMAHATLDAAHEAADIIGRTVTVTGIYDRKTRTWHDHVPTKGEAA